MRSVDSSFGTPVERSGLMHRLVSSARRHPCALTTFEQPRSPGWVKAGLPALGHEVGTTSVSETAFSSSISSAGDSLLLMHKYYARSCRSLRTPGSRIALHPSKTPLTSFSSWATDTARVRRAVSRAAVAVIPNPGTTRSPSLSSDRRRRSKTKCCPRGPARLDRTGGWGAME